MGNILIVSYAFPPDKNSQAQHVFGIASVLSKDNDVDLLTVEKNNLDIEVNFKIIYAKLGLLHRMGECSNSGSEKLNVAKKQSISSRVKKILIPDPTIDWYFNAIEKIKSSNKVYDLVIGIATPYTDLIIAHKIWNIEKKRNSDCKLISIYADPWFGEQSKKISKLRKSTEKLIENRILNDSSFIFMVTKNACKYYLECYPSVANKIDYYYLGHNFNFDNDLNEVNNSIITIKYFGAIQSVHRDPYTFLDVLDNKKYINKIKLILYLVPHISHQKIYEKIISSSNLKRIVEIKNAIPYKGMVQEIKNADYSLIFGNSSELQIPGKLFDYIGLSSKIIYIKNGSHSEIEKILIDYEGAIIVNNTYDDISESFSKIVNREITLSINKNVVRTLYRDTCYKKLRDKINQLI